MVDRWECAMAQLNVAVTVRPEFTRSRLVGRIEIHLGFAVEKRFMSRLRYWNQFPDEVKLNGVEQEHGGYLLKGFFPCSSVEEVVPDMA